MKFNETDILFASLLGSKVADSIPRFNKVQNELSKRVLPPIPFLPIQNQTDIEVNNPSIDASVWQSTPVKSASEQYFPFYIEDSSGTKWLLPYEPLVSINGSNTIIRRNVSKWKLENTAKISGSIKERWSQNDYEITITGVLIGSILTGNTSECFPRKDFEKLRDIVTAPEKLKVYCEPLQLLNIHHIVVESFNFPFTKGENVQAYEIKAYSDFNYELLLDIND